MASLPNAFLIPNSNILDPSKDFTCLQVTACEEPLYHVIANNQQKEGSIVVYAEPDTDGVIRFELFARTSTVEFNNSNNENFIGVLELAVPSEFIGNPNMSSNKCELRIIKGDAVIFRADHHASGCSAEMHFAHPSNLIN
jgi:hypothetical protein